MNYWAILNSSFVGGYIGYLGYGIDTLQFWFGIIATSILQSIAIAKEK